jgi:hypothetical protein
MQFACRPSNNTVPLGNMVLRQGMRAELESWQLVDSSSGIVRPGWTKTQQTECSTDMSVKRNEGFLQASRSLSAG